MEIRSTAPCERSHRNHRIGGRGEGPSGIHCDSEPEFLGLPLSCTISTAPVDILFDRIQRRGVEYPPIDRDQLLQWAEIFQAPTPEEFSLFDKSSTLEVGSADTGSSCTRFKLTSYKRPAQWRDSHQVVIIWLPQHPSPRIRVRGQVAQLVERSPEKAGVGGSTPSLATIIPKHLAAQSRNLPPKIPPKIITEFAP